MKFFVKSSTSGNWPEVKNFWVKTSEENPLWSGIKKAWVKVAETGSGSWKMFWSNTIPKIQTEVTIVATTDATTKEITLTGTNYYWTDADTLTYKIERSIDNGATWPTTLKSGTATNPSSGGSNTYTYVLLDNKSDVTPNVQNRYRFRVTATNTDSGAAGIAVSFADNEYVSGPEDITITETSKTYNSVTISWNAAQHANKYLVYYKLSSDSSYTFSKVIATTSTTVDSLSSSTAYNFKVVPITGVSNTYKGYQGNDSNVLAVTTDAPATPVQLTKPTISGTGYAFTSINGVSGTYQSGTYKSKTSYIGLGTSSQPADDKSALSVAGSPPYKVTQNDATAPVYIFYYVDKVTANDNTFYYFYSSGGISAKIGSLEDDYTRSVTGGLGYMTPVWDSLMSPSSYFYNLSAANSTWSVNGSAALNASAVSGTTPSNYPQQSIELGGKTDITSSVNFPAGDNGLGLVFWATSSGSWWASRVNRTSATATKYTWGTTGTENYTYYLGNRDVAGTVNKYNTDSTCVGYYVSRTTTRYTCSQSGCSSNGDGTCSRYVSGVGYVLCSSPATATVDTVCDSPSSSSIGSCNVYTYACTTCTQSGTGSFCGTDATTTVVCDVAGGSNCGPYDGVRDTCTGSNFQYDNATYPANACSKASSSVTVYSTALNILMANGSTVSSQASKTVQSATESPTPILGIKVITSGNSIISRAYSNAGLTSQLGDDLSHTPTSPTKASVTGASYAGIIKTPPGSGGGGTQFDNLKIS
jgi:hypothetical protein